MKTKTFKLAALCALLFGVFCLSVQPVFAAEGTDGSELQLLQAEQLEIQLGAEWSGIEFQLKTDAGLYPGVIAVGSDGVLRLEIGGSSSYVLSCLGSSVDVPSPAQTSAAGDSANPAEDESAAEQGNSAAAAGIPALHLILFVGGMSVAIAALIVMHVTRRKTPNGEYESDGDE